MNIVSRIRFPNAADVSDLYMKCSEGVQVNYAEGCRTISFTKDSILSLNTYFNSFYENFYAKYTEISSLYYLLKLEGSFQISLYREFYAGENRELINTEKFEGCQSVDCVKFLLPNLSQNTNNSRTYLEVMCLSKSGLFTGGFIVTAQNEIREVSLGIITCTFRKEAYVTNTVNTILQDELLKDQNFSIFIIDNGRTLKEDEFEDQRVKLIFNKNVGGSGGFTRGLIEALQEDIYTHFLFMDDDVELDSESVYRLFSLYRYAKYDFAIAGSMLDLYKKCILHEAGALYSRRYDNSGYHPFSVAPAKHKLDLKNIASLNLLLLEENLDYGGFWFFSFSKRVVEKIGLLMPFFIKRDDVEYSLRIKESLGSEIIAFPSIAVWHEPFYTKVPIWAHYYEFRNSLIIHSFRSSLEYVDAVKYLTKRIVSSLMLFDYNSVEILIKAFEDYMRGPAFIQSTSPEVLHSNVVELSKHHKSQNLLPDYYSFNQLDQNTSVSNLKKLVSILTLNGHLLPSFLMSNSEALVFSAPGNRKSFYKAFAKKKIIFRERNGCFYQNEIKNLVGIKLLIKWVKFAVTSSVKWKGVSAEWKNTSKYLTSTKFWQHYLELKTEVEAANYPEG
jgi:galactofuranosylgalactofuranosylrhamnosyl-N-acetylglucosaminyl-diphospho-decaprenol beta-1,5/1,6-galactofuranosyltransferase